MRAFDTRMLRRFWREGRRLAGDALRDRGGNTAVVVALSMVPMLLAAGASIDTIRTYNVRSKMQADLDTALIAAVRDIGTEDKVAIGKKVKDWFAAQQASLEGSYELGDVDISLVDDTITAKATGSVPTSLMALADIQSLPVSVGAAVQGASNPYMNIYIVIDKSASMMLAANLLDQARMQAEVGCSFACHIAEGSVGKTKYKTYYDYSQARGIQLRSDVVIDAVKKSIAMIDETDPKHERIKVGLYSIGTSAREVLAPTFKTSTVTQRLTSPGHGLTSATSDEFTFFDKSLPALTTIVGKGGDGKTADTPQKLVLMLTDGVQSDRDWVHNAQYKVAPLNPAWCQPMKTGGVTIAALYAEYLPMPWDWGYNATVGNTMGAANWKATWGGTMRAGVSSSISRHDYIPYALTDCATSPDLFLSAASASEIEKGLKTLLRNYLSALRLTQ